MANRQQASLEELDAETIGIVVIADLAQIEADASSHPDKNAQARILTAVGRLRSIAQGDVPPDVVSRLPQLQQVLFG